MEHQDKALKIASCVPLVLFALLVTLLPACVNTSVRRDGFALDRKALFNKIEASEISFKRTIAPDGRVNEEIVFKGPKSDSTKALETAEAAMELMKTLKP